MTSRNENRQPLKPGRANQYFEVGQLGRKTGVKTNEKIGKDEDGFDDLEAFFKDDSPAKQRGVAIKASVAPPPSAAAAALPTSRRVSLGGSGFNLMPSSEFQSKPLVGRTPPAAAAYSLQNNLHLTEYPTKRDMTPSALKMQMAHAPVSQSKLRNSFSRSDIDDRGLSFGGIRERLHPQQPSYTTTLPLRVQNNDSDSDEDAGGASAIRKRLGHSNVTLPSKPVIQASVLKNIAQKPNPSVFKPAPLLTRSPLATVARSPFAQPSPVAVQVFEQDYDREEDLHHQEPEFVQEQVTYDQDLSNAEEVAEEEFVPEKPVFKKPLPVVMSAKKTVPKKSTPAPLPPKKTVVQPVVEEETVERDAASYFAEDNFQDDYHYQPQEQEEEEEEAPVHSFASRTNKISSSSSGGLDEDFNPPVLESEEEEHVDEEEEEEEEEIKPKKKSHKTASRKLKSQVVRQTIPQKYLDEGERIGPNAVKIPVTRRYQEEDDGTRKSKRARIAPLAFWKNEKAEYTRRDSGISLQNIIRVFDEQGGVKARTAKTKQGGVSVKPKARAVVAKQEYMVEQPPAEIKVLNYATKQEEYQKIAVTPEMVDANRTVSTGDYSFQKVFSEGEFIASGVLELPHGCTKPSKNSHGSAMMFVVVSGLVEVQVHKTTFQLVDGGQFFVPRGNQYSITNVGSDDATLYFCHGKQISSF